MNLVPELLGIVGLLTLAGGTVAITGAVPRWRRERSTTPGRMAATGRIVGCYLPPGSVVHAEGPRYTIEFTTSDGRVMRFVTDSIGLVPRPVGSTVDVLYEATNPDAAYVRGERSAAYVLGVAGVIFTAVGALVRRAALPAGRHRHREGI